MDECTDGEEQVAMGARTRGPASLSEKAGNYGVAEEPRRGTGRGRGPPIGDENNPDHKGHSLPGEEGEIVSPKPRRS